MSEFIEKNSTFILAVLGMLGGGVSILFRFMIKSRCSEIKCLGCFIKREVIPASQIQLEPSNNEENV